MSKPPSPSPPLFVLQRKSGGHVSYWTGGSVGSSWSSIEHARRYTEAETFKSPRPDERFVPLPPPVRELAEMLRSLEWCPNEGAFFCTVCGAISPSDQLVPSSPTCPIHHDDCQLSILLGRLEAAERAGTL